MPLALFDLDNTLIAGDSDHLWGDFLIAHQIVHGKDYKAQNDQFDRDYTADNLDILAYLRFTLAPLSRHGMAQLQSWHEMFMAEYIEPILLPRAQSLIENHRQAGDTLVIITASNDFVTAPIAKRLGIDVLIATQAEIKQGRYSGLPQGAPCYREGKISKLNSWLAAHQETLDGAFFYSDSHNDLPLLSHVSNPTAVDPDPILARHASGQGWPVISLRNAAS